MNVIDKQEYGCSASVTFTIRVTGKGYWGKEATVDEVQRIGGRETIKAVVDALDKAGLQFTHVEKPKVGAVTWGPIE